MPAPPARKPLGQGALRHELHLKAAVEVLLGEELVLADVRREHLDDLPVVEQQPAALAVDPHVVGDDREVAHPGVAQRSDEIARDAAETEAPDGDDHAVAARHRRGPRRRSARAWKPRCSFTSIMWTGGGPLPTLRLRGRRVNFED
jgi:hypothetical protein